MKVRYNLQIYDRLYRERHIIEQLCIECLESDYDKDALREKIRDVLNLLLGGDEK